MNLISVKQNEILTLCSKLEEKNLSRLEEAELRERINDLVVSIMCKNAKTRDI